MNKKTKEDIIQGIAFTAEIAMFFLAGLAWLFNPIASIFYFACGFLIAFLLGRRMERKAIEDYKWSER